MSMTSIFQCIMYAKNLNFKIYFGKNFERLFEIKNCNRAQVKLSRDNITNRQTYSSRMVFIYGCFLFTPQPLTIQLTAYSNQYSIVYTERCFSVKSPSPWFYPILILNTKVI